MAGALAKMQNANKIENENKMSLMTSPLSAERANGLLLNLAVNRLKTKLIRVSAYCVEATWQRL